MEPGIRWPAKVPMLSDRNVPQPHVLAPRKQQNDFFSQVVETISDREKKKRNKQAVVLIAHHTDARTKKEL